MKLVCYVHILKSTVCIQVSDLVMTPYILILSMESKRGNVANQREHLILLLANMDVRNRRNLDDYTTVKA